MPKCFIFSLGGSGARVLKSFLHLLSVGAGLPEHEGWEFVPILVDLDEQNGDLTSCKSMLNVYQELHEKLNPSTVADRRQSPSFKHKVSSLSGDENDFTMPINLTNKDNLKKFIGYDSLRTNLVDNKELSRTADLLDLLYSEDEMSMQLSFGFKGHPNIGSMIFNQLTYYETHQSKRVYKNEIFKKFISSYTSNDRVLVISSIFGGTGASGYPHLMKVFNDLRSNVTSFSNLKVGTLSMMPYFKLEDKKGSHIDYRSFITKTKAALHYYRRKVNNMNVSYYVGAEKLETEKANNEGGASQKNSANITELVAATSIFHFLGLSDEQIKLEKADDNTYRFGVENNDMKQFNLYSFDDYTKDLIATPLIYMYFNYQINRIINIKYNLEHPEHNGSFFTNCTWGANTELVNITRNGLFGQKQFEPSFLNTAFYDTYTNYLHLFWKWLEEISENGDNSIYSFLPFNLNPRLGASKIRLSQA